jgi:hypothetical protein
MIFMGLGTSGAEGGFTADEDKLRVGGLKPEF